MMYCVSYSINLEGNMSVQHQTRFASFEDFYEALDADRHISERLDEHPTMRDQIKESLRKLYQRTKDDPAFERQLSETPKKTALAFFQDEMSHYELSDDELEAVAGGKITTETSLAYDVGYVLGSAVEWVVGVFD